MRTVTKIGIASMLCGLAVAIAVGWTRGYDPFARSGAPGPFGIGVRPVNDVVQPADLPPRDDFLDYRQFEEGGLEIAGQFTGMIHDPNSLADLKAAVEDRQRVGLATLEAELRRVRPTPEAVLPTEQAAYVGQLLRTLGLLQFYAGQYDRASASFEEARALAAAQGASWRVVGELTVLKGIVALRRGEEENCIGCLGPSSCIFPLAPSAVHTRPSGSREAVGFFRSYLDQVPGDLRVRWMLNLACMTLGEYPAKVPPAQLIPLPVSKSSVKLPRYENVALAVGLTVRGTNQAGGSIFDDFNGDGRPDLLTTSLDVDRGPSLFVNNGDGTFVDRTAEAKIQDQVYALNLARADFDNDGDLDVVLLRGGWESPMRMSLLRNNGKGSFDDVTLTAGLNEPVSSETAGWADYDNDGDVDLFVGAEWLPPYGRSPGFTPDPHNHSRLYRNNGDGTFTDVAEKAGLVNEQCAKGCAWGDYDDDGRPDLYISNMTGPGRLYHNEGDGTFRDRAADLGVTGPNKGFACWWFDYDNDGRIDLFVNDYMFTLSEMVAHELGRPTERKSRPRLYRNLGPDGFAEVSREVGLDSPQVPMGCNFGDIDNDGFLDFYLGTGVMSFEYLVPNRLFHNVEGKRFEDVTIATGTGHLQKGHGVSFADYDDDGDLDLFCEAGGGVPGDRAYNLLFQNPTRGRHALKVRLVGKTSNRSALGAKIKVTATGPDGTSRVVHRTVGHNGSFGGNSLEEVIGLGGATQISALEVTWPTSKTTQTFRDLPADRAVVVTEGDPKPAIRASGNAVVPKPGP
ncbi:MAG: CRTAC1 family protein [Isosphaeraceae bacterium]